MIRFDKSLVWFRRDLRCFDHAALYHALEQSRAVFCVFVFDTAILDRMPRRDRRISFIHDSLTELDAALRQRGGGLVVRHGAAAAEIVALARELGTEAVFCNRDYEPQARARDERVETLLKADGRRFFSWKDQVVFEQDELLTQGSKPYSVFTPYKNAWMKQLHAAGTAACLDAHPVDRYSTWLASHAAAAGIPSLDVLGFERPLDPDPAISAGMSGGQAAFDRFVGRMRAYGQTRDFPAIDGSSRLSVHLRFGTVSVRALVRRALEEMHAGEATSGAGTWLGELVWREFYFMILHHHPRVVERAFKPEYDAIAWHDGPDADALFEAWCDGRTGYPLVDAGMRQLNRTGYMHNRLRMVTASFLVKDLGIDWRLGERYFAEKLLDYDLAANNGGWQWAASSGCDAQPYFRIFNPVTQSQKFDADGKFLRCHLPELDRLPAKHLHAPWLAPAPVLRSAGIELGTDYPMPVVSHDEARRQTLSRYSVVRKPASPAP